MLVSIQVIITVSHIDVYVLYQTVRLIIFVSILGNIDWSLTPNKNIALSNFDKFVQRFVFICQKCFKVHTRVKWFSPKLATLKNWVLPAHDMYTKVNELQII